jgi:predicted acetyltransferase
MSDLTVRTLTEDDYVEFSTMLNGAFLVDTHDGDDAVAERAGFEPERHHGVFDGTRMVGSTGIQTRNLTVPGVGPTPAAGVTSVGVAPDARRRGVLTAAMRAQLDQLREAGAEPVAVLWASQAPIYGRFGYGCASYAGHLSMPAQ